jgi:hypothetical protein
MAGGRPRTVSFEPEEMILLGEEMLKWVKENDPIHLSMWYYGVKYFLYEEWETMIKRPEFVGYYERAMSIIGYKYLKKDSPIEPSLKQRWARVYFKDLRKQEDFDADAQAKRTKDIEGAKQSTYNILVPHDLAIGSNISAAPISNTPDTGSK